MSIRHSAWWAGLLAVLVGLAQTPAAAQGITVPNTFTNGTVADATQVNANFAALAANALNRNGGTLGGTLNLNGQTLSGAATASGAWTFSAAGVALAVTNNATVGGTFGVTGVTTLSALLDASGAAAGQIKFPATQNASTNANTLDDYKEGAWTPADSSGAGLAITVNAATYVKMGQLVAAWFDITYPVTASGTAALVGGLPFTSNAAGVNSYGGPVYVSTYVNPISAMVASTSATFRLYTVSNTQLTNADLSTTTSRGFVIYRAGT